MALVIPDSPHLSNLSLVNKCPLVCMYIVSNPFNLPCLAKSAILLSTIGSPKLRRSSILNPISPASSSNLCTMASSIKPFSRVIIGCGQNVHLKLQWFVDSNLNKTLSNDFKIPSAVKF